MTISLSYATHLVENWFMEVAKKCLFASEIRIYAFFYDISIKDCIFFCNFVGKTNKMKDLENG